MHCKLCNKIVNLALKPGEIVISNVLGLELVLSSFLKEHNSSGAKDKESSQRKHENPSVNHWCPRVDFWSPRVDH